MTFLKETTKAPRRIKQINEIQIAKTFKSNEYSKKTLHYQVSQLIEMKKFNELVYVKCSISDISIQQDCILSFTMHDLNDNSIILLGKYWSKCKVSEFIHQSSYIVLGKLKHSFHKKNAFIFDCVWISLGKENALEF